LGSQSCYPGNLRPQSRQFGHRRNQPAMLRTLGCDNCVTIYDDLAPAQLAPSGVCLQ